jgi:hypothetical protein
MYLQSVNKRRAHVRAAMKKIAPTAGQVARLIGADYSTLLNWRHRGSVPRAYHDVLRNLSGGYFDPRKVSKRAAA